LLADYGGRLPLAWFTPQLQEALLTLTKEALLFKTPELNVATLTFALRLWSFWIRRLGEYHNSPYLEVVVDRVLAIFQLIGQHEVLHTALEPCVITLSVSVGKCCYYLNVLVQF
jgi:hypothetical protein